MRDKFLSESKKDAAGTDKLPLKSSLRRLCKLDLLFMYIYDSQTLQFNSNFGNMQTVEFVFGIDVPLRRQYPRNTNRMANTCTLISRCICRRFLPKSRTVEIFVNVARRPGINIPAVLNSYELIIILISDFKSLPIEATTN